MRKKYLLWGYAVIAICSIVILIAITLTSLAGMKGARDHMSKAENRKAIYDTAVKVMRDTGLKLPDFRVQEQKAGHFERKGSLFQDTLIIYFYKGFPEEACRSFEARAKVISETKDTAKSVIIQDDNYYYQDRYVKGFRSSIRLHVNRQTRIGEIIYGNWAEK